MKTGFKKVFAVVLALAMVLSAIPAMADVTAGSITVNNLEKEGDTVKFVQVIEPDQTTVTGWKFVDGYATYFKTAYNMTEADDQAVLAEILADAEGTDNGNAAAGNASNSAEFRAAIKAILANATFTTTAVDNASGDLNDAAKTVKVQATKAGVYAIKATSADASVNYNDMAAFVNFEEYDALPEKLQDVTVDAKSVVNTAVKDAVAGTESLNIGDAASYTIETIYPDFGDLLVNPKFVITDSSSNLNLSGVTVAIKINDADVPVANYTVDAQTGIVTITFKVDAEHNYAAYKGKPVVVTISNAIVTSFSNDDQVINDATVTTNPDTTKENDFTSKSTYISDSFEFVLTKTNDYTDNENLTGREVLPGAKFKVYAANSTAGDAYWFLKTADGVYQLVPAGTSNAVQELDNHSANGTLTLTGLDGQDTYFIFETLAPVGYTLTNTPVEITGYTVVESQQQGVVDGVVVTTTTATVVIDDANDNTEATMANMLDDMKNTKLGTLPSTGGIGTYVFTMVGTAAMAAAVIFFMNRKETIEA